MISVVANPVIVLFTIGVIIFIHELGHFLLARFNKVDVIEFAIGFGPRLFSWTHGGTIYAIRAIPFGGFVRMSGDDRLLMSEIAAIKSGGKQEPADKATEEKAALNADNQSMEGRDEEIRALLERPDGWFLSKGYFAKSAIVIAGPLFNVVFAILLAIGSLVIYGEAVMEEGPVIGDVQVGHPADKAGIRPGDRIISINEAPMSSWQELASTIRGSGGKELEFVIERKGKELEEPSSTLTVRVQPLPDSAELEVVTGAAAKGHVIGIIPSFTYKPMAFGDSVLASCDQVWRLSVMTARSFWGLVSGKLSRKHVGGPIQMFQEASRSAKRGGGSLLGFMIFINVTLAVLNLLPIPILDGGHLLFFTYEAIKGSAISVVAYQRMTAVGMILIMSLMLLALTNDIGRVLGFY